MEAKRKQRGVLYVVWKRKSKEIAPVLRRSIESLYKHHPELPSYVHELPDSASLLDKSKMMAFSPFEETLFLDADTIVHDRLDYGFEQACKHHLALCICESPWAKRYDKAITGDVIEYNTGVMFFSRSEMAQRVFVEWEKAAFSIDSSIRFEDENLNPVVMPMNDQGGFAKAVHDLSFNPFVLPLNWNFRPLWHKTFFGTLKVWHDYAAPIPELVKAVETNRKLGKNALIQLG
ncbi:MAG: hypothetical protein ACT4PL_07045 [Phycisphaerales bacterium]